MSAGAWWMLVLTWAMVFWFAGRFLWLVLTLPPPADAGPEPGPSADGEP